VVVLEGATNADTIWTLTNNAPFTLGTTALVWSMVNNEVWVGPDTPTNPNTELWYDTDEANLTDVNTARWNSSWGAVAVGSFLPADGVVVAANASITSTINMVALQGRRYRLTCLVRAITQNGGTAYAGLFFHLADNGVQGQDRYNIYPIQSQGYAMFHAVWLFTGDGATHAWDVRNSGTPLIMYTQTGAIWMVEDIGPVSQAANPPLQPASVWTPLTFTGTWGNYDPSGNSYDLCQYRLVGDRVELRGLAKSTGTDVNIGTLPVGCRPPRSTLWATYMANSVGNMAGRFDVSPSGIITAAVHQGAGPFGYLSLNCFFSVTF
jgi:hypothetical protein